MMPTQWNLIMFYPYIKLFSVATQYAKPLKYGGKWGAECFNMMVPGSLYIKREA